ncbi:Uncharacterized conserved protein YtfP, gamma-glutamylcyclotransferase (GGCT)/AIG2-like family [Thermanaeromonas toyohensis ToBE]|uniref:Gamma-glutamylcyclotransferase family protein n=1 Tax=Thermanaeromonas toyohensis ToBE TaxID=698762 RepID=A0A1W1VZH7_9FIRM|nr:gamma-glutamylcyclotransferase family protein [Thermanaeromonas toyohensis]SMB98673.1 Uncharacterized conserved protein YtfP, gamma-glutamylcyclotransferase (GGCT)/AIG2-like family [Thermanaeromonas toyohensis ToBE]
MPENLFVYGSLLRGRRNHWLLEQARFLGEAMAYEVGLYAVTPYFPGAIPEKGKVVRGELYEVSLELLLCIDKLEDNGKLYRRRLWPVVLAETGEKMTAWLYFWLRPVHRETAIPWEEQPWKPRPRRKSHILSKNVPKEEK